MRTEDTPFNRPLSPVERAAVAAFPELLRLIELRRDCDWTLQPIRSVGGDVELVAGARVWPDGWNEAIAIWDTTNVRAFRYNPDGGEVWSREGTLVDVIDSLIDLPAPGEPGAPTLVKGRVNGLWLPGMPLA